MKKKKGMQQVISVNQNEEKIIEQIISTEEEISLDENNSTGQKKILIVDDDAVNLFLAQSILNLINPNGIVIEASNGKEAVEQFRKERPDLIFMDIQMPEMNGYEATIEIRKIRHKKRVPIIALTAGTTKGDVERCYLAGMDDYASKPVKKELFENMLLKWLV